MPSVIYTECRKLALYVECHYARCRYAECHGAICRINNNLLRQGSDCFSLKSN
jgi:hypothetical protein